MRSFARNSHLVNRNDFQVVKHVGFIYVKDCNDRRLWGTLELPPPPVGSLYPIALVGDVLPTRISVADRVLGMNGSTVLHIPPSVPQN
jgi:hypothetical protein